MIATFACYVSGSAISSLSRYLTFYVQTIVMKEEMTAAKVFSSMSGKSRLSWIDNWRINRFCSFRYVAEPSVDVFLSHPYDHPSQGLS